VNTLKITLKVIVLLAFTNVLPAQAQINPNFLNDELSAASRSISEGHVKQGRDRLVTLLRQIDPAKDKDSYWRTSATLVEFLSQIEDHPQALQVLNSIFSTKIPENQPAYRQWMQFYVQPQLGRFGKGR
jgi:hypothetical protein